MVAEYLNSIVPLATIVGAAAAPTIAAIWAGRVADRNAQKAADLAALAAMKVAEVKSTLVQTSDATKSQLGEIHTLVNNQLSQAVDRFNKAAMEIEELKILLKESNLREHKNKVPNEGLP
jgi:flagellar hook-associated protein FlgK